MDEEDFSFSLDTSTGLRTIVMSRTALGRIAGSNTVDPDTIVRDYRGLIQTIVERKIAKGRAHEDIIRLHGTDL